MNGRHNVVAVICTAMILAFLAGCEGNTRAVFTKPELITYERLAVLGLDFVLTAMMFSI